LVQANISRKWTFRKVAQRKATDAALAARLYAAHSARARLTRPGHDPWRYGLMVWPVHDPWPQGSRHTPYLPEAKAQGRRGRRARAE
jgi:hypothetical protein